MSISANSALSRSSGQAQDVADEVAREDGGAGSDEGDLRHQFLPMVMG